MTISLDAKTCHTNGNIVSAFSDNGYRLINFSYTIAKYKYIGIEWQLKLFKVMLAI